MSELLFAEGDEVNVGKPLYVLQAGDAAPSNAAPSNAAATPKAPMEQVAVKQPASSAPAPAPASKAAAAVAPSKAATSSPAAPQGGDRSESRVKMTRMRMRIAQRLKESQNTAAALTTFQEVDMGNLIDMRNKYKDDFEKAHGVKLGFMSAFVKVLTLIVSFHAKLIIA